MKINIEIKTDNGFENLILSPETSFRVEANSTLFEGEIIPGDKVYAFDIPNCSRNNKILGSSYFIPKNEKVRIYECNYFISGILFFSGHLIILKITTKKYISQISINPFVVNFKDKNLQEIDYGDDIFLGANTAAIVSACNTIVTQDYPDTFVQFPNIKNIGAYGTNPTFGWYGSINHYSKFSNTFLDNTGGGNVYAMSAQPYLVHIILNLFKEQGYSISGVLFSDEEFLKLLLYSNYLLDNIEADKYLVEVDQSGTQTHTIINTFTNETIVIDFDNTISDADAVFSLATDEYTISASGFHEINLLSTIKISTGFFKYIYKIVVLIDSVEVDSYGNFNGEHLIWYDIDVNFTIDIASADIGKKLQIAIYIDLSYFSNVPLVPREFYIKDSLMTIYPTSYSVNNIFKGEFNISDIVPDETIFNFLNAVKDFFRLGLFFNFRNKEISIITTDEIISSNEYFEIDEYIDNDYEIEIVEDNRFSYNFSFENDDYANDNFQDIADYNYIGAFNATVDLPAATAYLNVAFIKNRNQYFFTDGDDVAWKYYTDNFFDYNISSALLDFKPNMAPLFMGHDDTRYGPEISQKASTPYFNVGMNPPGLRLMIWNGMIGGNTNTSNNNYDYDGNIVGDLSLRWDDENYGIYAKWHKKWTNFITDSETIRIIGSFPVNKYFKLMSLFEPNDDKCHKIRFRKINFIPKKISALHESNKELVEVEIYMTKSGNIEI